MEDLLYQALHLRGDKARFLALLSPRAVIRQQNRRGGLSIIDRNRAAQLPDLYRRLPQSDCWISKGLIKVIIPHRDGRRFVEHTQKFQEFNGKIVFLTFTSAFAAKSTYDSDSD